MIEMHKGFLYVVIIIFAKNSTVSSRYSTQNCTKFYEGRES